jgi:hypothetical protein
MPSQFSAIGFDVRSGGDLAAILSGWFWLSGRFSAAR